MVNTGTQLTLEEFLALPDGDIYYELVDGQAIPKVSPKYFHSTLHFTSNFANQPWDSVQGEGSSPSRVGNSLKTSW